MPFCVGLDLGQSADYTALAVVQEGEGGDLLLRHLERYRLHTPYPDQADAVAALMRDERLVVEHRDPWDPTPRLERPELVVDATGVGRAVTDILKTKGLEFRAVTITGGDKATAVAGGYHVPKRDLVAALEVPFHTGALKVAEGLELWPALRKELLAFRRKINLKTAHDSYEHWRDSDHDDLVLAVALACWWTRRKGRDLRPIAKPRGL
jgi:hypothetical protein